MKLQDFLNFIQNCPIPIDPECEVFIINESTQEVFLITATIVDTKNKVMFIPAMPSGSFARPVGVENSPDPSKLN